MQLLNHQNFEAQLDGQSIQLFDLKNNRGMTAQITNYGGRVVSLWVPDRVGNFSDVVLGFDHIEDYLSAQENYFGALIGRCSNRIANGKFELNGLAYELELNNGPNHLHGGPKGFHNVVWKAVQLSPSSLQLSYLSKDTEAGYPGNLDVKVVYTLSEDNGLEIYYTATTDQTTPVSFTHHSFFNLKGAGQGDINDHILQIHAEHFTPVDETLIPTGIIASLHGTPLDFNTPQTIGARINGQHGQLEFGVGYDHNYVLKGEGVRKVARVEEPLTGRTLDVFTDLPGLQFYSGNFLNGEGLGKSKQAYPARSAFCLEAQYFPNSPNQVNFPTCLVHPGETYTAQCIYQFGQIE